MKSIVKGAKVTLHFSLAFDCDVESIIDSTFDGSPAQLTIGDGNLPQGFESYIMGMKAGEEQTFTVPPEQAFGQKNPNNVQEMARKDFDDMSLEEGLVVSFADASKNELPGVVQSFDDKSVTVDFNHPLAGQALNFRVKVIEILSATDSSS